MTRKEAFEKIKRILFGEQKFEQAKLKDGTIVSWEGELAEGVALFVIETDGNQVPAPDGEHTLEDGTVITTVGGLVASIKPAEQTDEMKGEDEFAKIVSELAERFAKIEQELSELKGKFEAQEQAMKSATESIESVKTETKEKFSKVVELVEAISNEPSVNVNQHTVSPESFKRKNKQEDINELVRKVLKNK